MSYTVNLDPVSGYGFHGGGLHLANRAAQLAAAAGCFEPVLCPHLDYQLGYSGAGLVENGAILVANQLKKYGIT